jgi:phage major tail protein, phi13 family
MALVNVDKLYFAVIDRDEIGAGNLLFQKPEYIPGVQQFQAKLKTDTGTLYEEGVLSDQDSIISEINITVDLGHLVNSQYAKYLGHHVDSNGGVYALEGDKAPYIAILYEYTKSGSGVKGFKIYYKGQLVEPDDSVKQKEGKVDYQNHTVEATFQPLKNNGMWKYTLEEDDPLCPANIKETFFNSVIIPESDKEAPTINTVPTNGAVGVAANTSVVFTSSKALADLYINNSNIFIFKSDGNQVDCDLTVSEDKKVITLQPKTDLEAGAYTAIMTKNVRSSSGTTIADSIAVNFTV